MIEKILLSITLTFSLYLSLQSSEFSKQPISSVRQLSVIPEQPTNQLQ
ncbi:MAG TPA: hypothetical protein V6D11_15205 [Waterburya sp.]|jgi:hypothetical protein